MKKFLRAAVVGAIVSAAAIPNSAFAVIALPAPPPAVISGGGGGAGAGAAATGGFIGIVALLVTYDIIRRTTCSGDFLGLGGPGFTSPITEGMSIIPPQCAPAAKHVRHRKH